jgi:thioredoxin-like negative regulator of GroEL
MPALSRKDLRHLKAAEGWLELGNWREADREVNCIKQDRWTHPDVLFLGARLFKARKKWESCARLAAQIAERRPKCADHWLLFAEALHHRKKNHEAFCVLLHATTKVDDVEIRYQLARYASLLRRPAEGLLWFSSAFAASKRNPKLRLRALEDDALKPLWSDIKDNNV